MKSKIKKIIKRCTIFLTVFTLVFSCFCFRSAALGDNSNGLSMSYNITPKLQRKDTNTGQWVDVADYQSRSFVQSPDGSIDKVVYSWTGLYGLLNSGYSYRVLFRFNLVGPNASQYSLAFNGYISRAVDYASKVDDPNRYISYSGTVGDGGSKTQYFTVSGDGPSSYTAEGSSTVLKNRPGELFSFKSRDEVKEEYQEQYPDINSFTLNFYTIGVVFEVSRDLQDFTYTLDNFSTDLFFPSPDTGNIDSYDSAEQDLLNATEEGRAGATSIFNNFGGLVEASNFREPLLAVGLILSEFFEINFVNSLLSFGLAVGLFAFLVGMGSMLVSRFSSRSRSDVMQPFNEKEDF